MHEKEKDNLGAHLLFQLLSRVLKFSICSLFSYVHYCSSSINFPHDYMLKAFLGFHLDLVFIFAIV